MKIISTLAFFLLTIALNAQTRVYSADLSALKLILQKTPSYKAQIKGSKQPSYNALYNRLASDTLTNPDSYSYFFNLSKLLFPLRDNHLGFYQIPDYDKFKDKASLDRFTASKEFLDYPKTSINIDSLKTELSKKPPESIEGIYHFDKFYSVGLFKSGDKEYTGVVVDSDIKLWQKGQIAIHLYEYGPNLYKAVYGHPLFKNFTLRSNEKYKNQSLINSFFYTSYAQNKYSKLREQHHYVNLEIDAPKFKLESISDKVQYLLIRTFMANNSTMKESSRFHDSIQNSLTAENLILDLRNNEGGAEKESRKYLKLLKKYVKKRNLYVLINNETVSQAEIFTLSLKKLKNTTILGQATKGMLTYGNNYGRREKLPSGKFEIYITDMKGKEEHLKYENYGIEPDIPLNNNSNWLDQAVEIIRKKFS